MKELLNILQDIRPDVDFSYCGNLIDDGILDSFDIISLVSEINQAFDIEIGVAELVPENFNSPEAIFALIKKLQG